MCQYRNKLTKLELQKVYYDAKTADVVNDYVVRNEPGRALGGFYGYISDGVDPETGELMYRDLNNDGKISSSDRTYIGDPNPDFTYGMTNTFSWKGFNLSIFIQGSYGNDIYNASRIETEGMYDGKNQSARVLNRWKIPAVATFAYNPSNVKIHLEPDLSRLHLFLSYIRYTSKRNDDNSDKNQ